MKKIILILALGIFFIPTRSLAALDKTAPEFNPLCWRLEACENSRGSIINATADDIKKNIVTKEGWVQEDPCTGNWGKCLPSGKTVTEIAFGGKKEYANIGDFIKGNYNLAINVAAILAVIMIIVAGVQWTVSGGNSEMITGAKKRIGGALIGLVIAYLSYTILNTINPAMVNLRLPQTWMIRPFKVGPEFCYASESQSFALAAKKADDPNKINWEKKLEEVTGKFLPTSTQPFTKMACGDKYFADGSGTQTCMGASCVETPETPTCLPVTLVYNSDEVIEQPNCTAGQLVVHFSIQPDAFQMMAIKMGWSFGYGTVTEANDWLLQDSFAFIPICKNTATGKYYDCENGSGATPGTLIKIVSIKKPPFWEYYAVFDGLVQHTTDPNQKYLATAFNNISPDDTLAGFVLKSETSKNWSTLDAYTYSSDQKSGVWKSISSNGFISAKDINNGKLVQSVLTTADLNELYDKDFTFPNPSNWDAAVGTTVDPIRPNNPGPEPVMHGGGGGKI